MLGVNVRVLYVRHLGLIKITDSRYILGVGDSRFLGYACIYIKLGNQNIALPIPVFCVLHLCRLHDIVRPMPTLYKTKQCSIKASFYEKNEMGEKIFVFYNYKREILDRRNQCTLTS